MPIDLRMVKWDDAPAAPQIDPRMVRWQDVPQEALPQSPTGQPIPIGEKVLRGMADPIEGGAQLFYNVLPHGVRDAGDALNNWIADKTGLVGRIPDRGLNQAIQEGESDYQTRRAAAGESGIDAWRLAGNVVSPANLVVASRAAALGNTATTAGKVLAGAAAGTGQGALAPVTSNDYWATKGGQVALSGATGAVLPMIGAKVFPKRSADAKMLKDAGIDVPIGSQMGTVTKSVEDRATSLPLVGDAINYGRRHAIDQFNIATLNRALSTINAQLPKGTKAGRDAVEKAGQIVRDKYNALLPKLNVKADQQFVAEMGQLKQLAQNLPDNELNQFTRIMANEVDGKFTSAGLMSGETMKQVEAKLGQLARGYGRSEGYEKQQLADALRQAQANLRAMVERNNPQFAGELQSINKAFAAMLRPERAATYVGAENGVFTPNQLLSAVKSTDPSLRHKAFARGNAMMQDWAESAKSVLPNKYPDSGTAGRVLLGGGAAAASMLNPQMAIPAAAAMSAYMPIGRTVASGLLTGAEGAGNLIASRAPYIAPLAAPFSYGLLDARQ